MVAVTSKARADSLPNVPTVGSALRGYEFYSWYGLWGASCPTAIRQRLNTEVSKALASADMHDKFTPQGLLLTPAQVDDFVQFQRDDMATSQKIITEGNIRVE